MYESDDKMVSHPPHYQSKSGLEVLDVIDAFTEDLSGYEATRTGNIIKYICRWKHKNGIQDLKKAMFYLQDLIEKLEEEEKKRIEDASLKAAQYEVIRNSMINTAWIGEDNTTSLIEDLGLDFKAQ